MSKSDYPLQIRDLGKTYGSTVALTDVTMTLAPGTVTGLLGRNGAGKTTLIKCVLGLLQSSKGGCWVFGEDSRDLPASIKSRIGYVPQEPDVYPWMRVSQVIAYQGSFYPHWEDRLAAQLLDTFRLPPKKRVGTLSVGQLQKLAILLALCNRPDLLILDEPVAALDPEARRDFLLMLIDLVADEAHTVLFSTHITSDVERVCSHIAVLKDGALLRHDDLDTLRDSFKEVRLATRSPLSEGIFQRDGILRYVPNERGAVLIAEGDVPELVRQLRLETGADITVVDLSLEDLFLELHRPSSPAVAAS